MARSTQARQATFEYPDELHASDGGGGESAALGTFPLIDEQIDGIKRGERREESRVYGAYSASLESKIYATL